MTEDASKKLADILKYNRDQVGKPSRAAKAGDKVKVNLSKNEGVVQATAGTNIKGGQPVSVVKTPNGPVAIQGQTGGSLGSQSVINEVWEEDKKPKPLSKKAESSLITLLSYKEPGTPFNQGHCFILVNSNNEEIYKVENRQLLGENYALQYVGKNWYFTYAVTDFSRTVPNPISQTGGVINPIELFFVKNGTIIQHVTNIFDFEADIEGNNFISTGYSGGLFVKVLNINVCNIYILGLRSTNGIYALGRFPIVSINCDLESSYSISVSQQLTISEEGSVATSINYHNLTQSSPYYNFTSVGDSEYVENTSGTFYGEGEVFATQTSLSQDKLIKVDLSLNYLNESIFTSVTGTANLDFSIKINDLLIEKDKYWYPDFISIFTNENKETYSQKYSGGRPDPVYVLNENSANMTILQEWINSDAEEPINLTVRKGFNSNVTNIAENKYFDKILGKKTVFTYFDKLNARLVICKVLIEEGDIEHNINSNLSFNTSCLTLLLKIEKTDVTLYLQAESELNVLGGVSGIWFTCNSLFPFNLVPELAIHEGLNKYIGRCPTWYTETLSAVSSGESSIEYIVEGSSDLDLWEALNAPSVNATQPWCRFNFQNDIETDIRSSTYSNKNSFYVCPFIVYNYFMPPAERLALKEFFKKDAQVMFVKYNFNLESLENSTPITQVKEILLFNFTKDITKIINLFENKQSTTILATTLKEK